MTLILVIAGLILLLAGAGWFTGAATVGWILLVAGAIGLVVQVFLSLALIGAGAKAQRDIRRKF